MSVAAKTKDVRVGVSPGLEVCLMKIQIGSLDGVYESTGFKGKQAGEGGVKMAGQKKVLLVDDEKGVLDILRMNLQAEGYLIYEAHHGKEALQMAKDLGPDLVVLDVMMPKMNGLEVLRRLEGDPRTAGVPVIMLSVRAEEVDIMRGLEQGAIEYVTKPFDPQVVTSKVKMLLEELDSRGRQSYRQQLMERRKRSMKPLHHLFDMSEE